MGCTLVSCLVQLGFHPHRNQENPVLRGQTSAELVCVLQKELSGVTHIHVYALRKCSQEGRGADAA